MLSQKSKSGRPATMARIVSSGLSADSGAMMTLVSMKSTAAANDIDERLFLLLIFCKVGESSLKLLLVFLFGALVPGSLL